MPVAPTVTPATGPSKPSRPAELDSDRDGNGVMELTRGWQPLRNLLPKISWWQIGVGLSNQLITPLSAGGKASANSTTAIDLTTSLGTGLNRRLPRDELGRWSLNLHLTNYDSTGNFGAEVGLVSSQFYPQSLFQSPTGLWLQGLWLQRNGLPHERLAQLKLGNLSLGNSFLHGDATNLYVNNLLNAHNGVSLPGVPYGPLNALGAIATVRLGRLDGQNLDTYKPNFLGGNLRFGLFQLDSQRNNSSFRGFNQNVSPGDGLLEIIEWQMPLARRLSHCNNGKKRATGLDLIQDSTNDQANGKQARSDPHAGRFISPSGCHSDQLVQNQLPEPMLLLTVYNANWGFAGVNGPSIQGQAPPGQVPTGTQANGIGLYLAIPPPMTLGFASRIWLSGSFSGPATLNPYPTYLAGGWIGQGLLPDRPQDLLILGLAGSSTSAALQPNQPGAAVLELSYQLQLTSKMSFQPYSQLQNGLAGQGPLWTIGMQWSWSL
jgi:porin